jgi:uncharacterized membrane protein YphA (DoxX/SURF4 family)
MIYHNFSHVKWFQTPVSKSQPSLTLKEFVAVIFIVSALLGIAFLIQRKTKLDEIISKIQFKSLAKFAPLILRVTSGTGLLIIAWQGGFFILALVAFSWIIGAWVKLFSALFLAVFLLAMFYLSPLELGEQLEYVGIAIYLLLIGGGPFSLDNIFLKPKHSPDDMQKQLAYRCLIGATGIALIWLALSEKLLNIDLAQAFINNGHAWNFLSILNISDRNFIIFIGSMELLFGVMLLLNVLPRLIIISIAITMAVTASLLGLNEVPGHLFAIGILAIILMHNNISKKPDQQLLKESPLMTK